MKKIIALVAICALAACNQQTDVEKKQQADAAALQAGNAAFMQQQQKNAEAAEHLQLK